MHGFDDILERTLDDRKLSRGERRAFAERIDDAAPTAQQLATLRRRAFDLASAALDDSNSRAVIEWCADVVQLLATHESKQAAESAGATSAALFSPGDACADKLRGLIGSARRSADICVFTITDDRISDAIHSAHRRGVSVRIVTDAEKAEDRGSDIVELARGGVPIAVDRSEHHMHHKFAVFDRKVLVTGSYNWTRSAARHNEENLVVTDDQRLLDAFQHEFDTLWERYG